MTKRAEWLAERLPRRLFREVTKLLYGYRDAEAQLFEISLRLGRVSSVTLGGKCIPLSVILTEGEMEDCFHALAGGSVYAHKETLAEGYLVLPYGCRAGIAGHAVTENGRLLGVYGITGISIRLPHAQKGVGSEAVRVFREMGGDMGLLIYAPPGAGKTTLLRDMAESLSTGQNALRVAIVDTRGEIAPCIENKNCLLDVLFGYPKPLGIEIATRTLAPNVICCDEIGSMAEAEAILRVESSGVPLVATAHAGSFDTLLSRPPIKLLWENGVFGAALGIQYEICSNTRRYTVAYRSEAEGKP